MAPKFLPLLAGETTLVPRVGHRSLDRLELHTGVMFLSQTDLHWSFWLFLSSHVILGELLKSSKAHLHSEAVCEI